MRKRIRELAEGKIECAEPNAAFSVERIELEVLEGEDYRGEFTVTSTNRVPVRGMVYSSNPRMECKTLGFEGEEVRISYEFHSTGLVEGNIQKGEFSIVCGQGEYTVPFAVVIVRYYADSKDGTVRSLKAFAQLAQTRWPEAKKLFYMPCFPNLLGPGEEKERLLYDGIADGRRTDLGLEEFLLACGCKEPVTVTVEQTDLTLYGIAEKKQQEVTISKDTWGYVELTITSDADFIELPKNRLTTDDFLGSKATVVFYLNPERMHAGRNFGRLVIKSVRQEIAVSVCAAAYEEGITGFGPTAKERQRLLAGLIEAYTAYRLKKTVKGKWAKLTLKLLDDLIVREPGQVWYRLLKAQTFWMNGQKQEAEWILSEFRRKWKDKRSPEWGYYLYICTFAEHEESCIDRMSDEIEQIYLEHKENPILFWCLLFLRRDYVQNRYQKLKALEERIMAGADSPVLYAEAYTLFLAEPYLMSSLGAFEEKIINWARKQNALTKELARQVISVFPGRLAYRKRTLLLLEACCGLAGDEQTLAVLCEYLIRNQRYGREFFRWYALGVEKKLRITGLYEAYLMSMDARSVQDVPRIIQMYFKYNNQLAYRLKAVLYVNLIASRKKNPKVYEQHYKGMEKFAGEQLALMHIDDNLAVIYEDVLSRGIYFSETSDALSKVLFVHRLTCFDPHAAKVIVLQDQLKRPCIVPIQKNEAYFPIYSDRYCILIEDCHGNRFGSSIPYQLEKLMYPGRYLRACMQNSPDCLPFLLHYFSNRRAQEFFEEKDLPYFKAVMAGEEISPAYKAELFPKLFGLLFLMDYTPDMEQELAHVDFSLVAQKDRGRILEMCIEKQLFEPAYWIAEAYGLEPLPLSMRVRLLNSQIARLEFAREEALLNDCADTFFAGKYNDAMLEYLCRYYQGPLRSMEAVFKSAELFYIHTQELSERILVQMLYTKGYTDCTDAIYKSYEEVGSPMLKHAYLTYFAHYGFVGSMLLSEEFYRELEAFWKDGHALNEVCELELLRYYAAHPAAMQRVQDLAEGLLEKYLLAGSWFPFYRQFDTELMMKYQLYDKYYIEHYSKKHSRVRLHYTLTGCFEKEDTGEYTVEDMAEAYDGVFVKKMVLFAGEAVQYYITEETDGKTEVTKSGILACGPASEELPESRYSRLNQLIGLKKEGSTDRFEAKMLEYEQLDHTVGQIFTII